MNDDNAFGITCLILALVVIALVIPPKYDPAIRFREWLDRRK